MALTPREEAPSNEFTTAVVTRRDKQIENYSKSTPTPNIITFKEELPETGPSAPAATKRQRSITKQGSPGPTPARHKAPKGMQVLAARSSVVPG